MRTAGYLSPEPMLQSPTFTTSMAARGLSVPTYAYANNNPLKYVDPDGRVLGVWGDDADAATLRRVLSALWQDPCSVELLRYLHQTPEYIYLRSPNFDRGVRAQRLGVTHDLTANTIFVDLNPDYVEIPGVPGVVFADPLADLLMHELFHAAFLSFSADIPESTQHECIEGYDRLKNKSRLRATENTLMGRWRECRERLGR